MTPPALQKLVDSINRGIIPLNIEHDPRIAPRGRVQSAELLQLQDGTWVVEGTLELFEHGDADLPPQDDRKLVIRRLHPGEIELYADRSFDGSEETVLVDEMAAALGTKAKLEIKKSIDPVSVLTIAMGVAAGSFFKSFFEKLGEEAAGKVISSLKAAFRPGSRRGQQDNLLVLSFCCWTKSGEVEVQVIATNPSESTLDGLFSRALHELDAVGEQHLSASARLRRLVYEYDGEALRPLFGVRDDGYPLRARLEDDSGGE